MTFLKPPKLMIAAPSKLIPVSCLIVWAISWAPPSQPPPFCGTGLERGVDLVGAAAVAALLERRDLRLGVPGDRDQVRLVVGGRDVQDDDAVRADVVGGPALPRVHAEQQHVDRAVQARAALGVGLARVTEQVVLRDAAGRLPDQRLAADDGHAAGQHQHGTEDHGQPGPERVLALGPLLRPTATRAVATAATAAAGRTRARPATAGRACAGMAAATRPLGAADPEDEGRRLA